MASKKFLMFLLLFFFQSVNGQSLIGPHQISGKDTVPSGEIWKVEAVLYDAGISVSSQSISGIDYFILNGNTVYTRQAISVSYPSGGAVVWEMKYPFWIGEGDIIEPKAGIGYISVLKFKQE